MFLNSFLLYSDLSKLRCMEQQDQQIFEILEVCFSILIVYDVLDIFNVKSLFHYVRWV